MGAELSFTLRNLAATCSQSFGEKRVPLLNPTLTAPLAAGQRGGDTQLHTRSAWLSRRATYGGAMCKAKAHFILFLLLGRLTDTHASHTYRLGE